MKTDSKTLDIVERKWETMTLEKDGVPARMGDLFKSCIGWIDGGLGFEDASGTVHVLGFGQDMSVHEKTDGGIGRRDSWKFVGYLS